MSSSRSRTFLAAGSLVLLIAGLMPCCARDAAAQSAATPPTSKSNQSTAPQANPKRNLPGMRLLKIDPVKPNDADAAIRARKLDPTLKGPLTPNGDLRLIAPKKE